MQGQNSALAPEIYPKWSTSRNEYGNPVRDVANNEFAVVTIDVNSVMSVTPVNDGDVIGLACQAIPLR